MLSFYKIFERGSTFWFLLLCAFSFTIVSPIKISGLITIFATLAWITSVSFERPSFSYLFRGPFISFMSFFLLHIIGLMYSSNFDYGIRLVERIYVFVIFPIILGFSSVYKQQIRKPVLFVFCFSVSFVSTLYLFIPVDLLDKIFTINRTYLGMFLLFTLAVLLHYTFLEIDKQSKWKTFGLGCWIIFNLFLLVQAGSKMPVILFVPLIFFFSLYQIRKRRNNLNYFLVFIGFVFFVSLIALLVYYNEFTRVRFERIYTEKFDYIRYRNWATNFEVIKKSPIVGFGTGDGFDELQRARNPNWHEYIFEYNSHNQYLETTVQLGILGFISLIMCTLGQLVFSIKRKDFIYSAMILIFSISCITESLLARQKGVLFFAFFSCFLFLTSDKYCFQRSKNN